MGDLETRAYRWVVGKHVGLSSKSIWAHMMGAGKPERGWSHPYDPDDLSRCLRLLHQIPEWKDRMPEMAKRSPGWAKLISAWDQIVQSMEDEVGWDWSKGQRAQATYNLMKSVLGHHS